MQTQPIVRLSPRAAPRRRPPSLRRSAGSGILLAVLALAGCGGEPPASHSEAAAMPEGPPSLLLTNARVYTLAWGEPGRDGTPAADAPVEGDVWTPDAEAIFLEQGRVRWVGAAADAETWRAEAAEVIDLQGATVLPGMVDSHTHIQGLGANLRRVDLVGVETVTEVVERLRSARPAPAAGEWIVGWGWDDGAWAANYPTWDEISEAFPDNPVILHSLHSFALWGNRAAFAAAGIDGSTEVPTGGEILLGPGGEPTGILLNRATPLLVAAVPPPSDDQLQQDLKVGLEEMARSGYVGIHEAGLPTATLAAFEALEQRGELPLRVYGMLSARDAPLMERYIESGPRCGGEAMLRICAVKAYWDGALGSRGARLLADYSDQPGHRGVSGEGYGFDQELVRRSIGAGFQVAIHAIGDAGNRETLDYLEDALARHPEARSLRHRIEHAQVVAPEDMPRFGELGLIASMQPPHMAEDKAWAEDRLGAERVRGAYAWRSLRLAGAGLIFNSDLAGSDHDLFYGLHSAVARTSPDGEPEGGWYGEQAVSMEEALRGYTTWAAQASFLEEHAGRLVPGAFADLTVLDIDPFELGGARVGELLEGDVRMTIVAGRVVFDGH